MTVAEATRLIHLRLAEVDAESGAHEARILMAHVLGIEVGALPVHRQMVLSNEQLALLADHTKRREAREPLQYIIGEWSFMGLPIHVDENVLIPRPETELVCEHAISLARSRGYKTALDLCTGSGCIAVALAACTEMAVTASDISMACVMAAEENARRNGVKISARQGDLFEAIQQRFDLIVCNPPYLSDADMRDMQAELRFEPALALHGGADGLSFYRRIADAYRRYLNPGGALLLEIGARQADEVLPMFEGASLHLDYRGLPRFIAVDSRAERDARTGEGR